MNRSTPQKLLTMALAAVFILTLTGCQFVHDVLFPERAELRYEKEAYEKMRQMTTPHPKPTMPEPLIKTPPPEVKKKTVTLLATGDVLMHQPILNTALQPDGSYEFAYSYRYIEPYVKMTNLACFNMEGTLAGEPYTGYPIFSAPDAVASTLKSVGFDLAYAANNHAMDRGVEGVKRTAKVLREAGLQVIGTREDKNEKGYVIQKINGMTIGLANFTYETSEQDGMRSLNGIPIPQEEAGLIDSFSIEDPALLEQDKAKISERIKKMREEGAEFIVFFVHWGTEYQSFPDEAQLDMGDFLTREGVDLIIGAGPHVIQEIRYLHQPQGGRTLCYYSLGNFVSNQQFDTADNGGYAEDGLVALIRLEKDPEGVRVKTAGYLPTYCFKLHPQEDHTYATILPVHAALENPEKFQFEGGSELLELSLERTTKVMTTNSKEIRMITKLSDFFKPEELEGGVDETLTEEENEAIEPPVEETTKETEESE